MSDRQSNYDRNGLNETLSRVETKVDALLDEAKDHSKRITILERWRYGMMGMAAAAGGLSERLWHWLQSVGKPPTH